MALKILNTANAEAGSLALPEQFAEEIREDLITRAVLALQAGRRQPYGGYGDAGMRHSTKLSKRRRNYRGSYGFGISRVPRKILSRRGRRMNWVGALAPGTVGGRRAHPPKPVKDWEQKINAKENRKAIRSALSATMHKDLVSERGHKIPEGFPFLVDNDFEQVAKAKDLEVALIKLGFADELDRAGTRKIRAGKGTMRGRKYKTKKSILFIISADEAPLARAAANLPGCEVVAVHRVNAELLAPGAHPGRLALFTKAAIERLGKERLFTPSAQKPEQSAKETEEKPKQKKAVKKTVKKVAKKTVKKAEVAA